MYVKIKGYVSILVFFFSGGVLRSSTDDLTSARQKDRRSAGTRGLLALCGGIHAWHLRTRQKKARIDASYEHGQKNTGPTGVLVKHFPINTRER